MSEKFRNLIFLLCVGACFLVLGLNIFVGLMVEQTFTSLYNEAAKAQQIMVAQDYAMQIGTLAEHEAQRAHELEQNMQRFSEQYMQIVKAGNNMAFQLEMQGASIEAQCSYIRQLTELLEANNIEVPVSDMKDCIPTSQGTYRVRIQINGKRETIGHFYTLEEAKDARNDAETSRIPSVSCTLQT